MTFGKAFNLCKYLITDHLSVRALFYFFLYLAFHTKYKANIFFYVNSKHFPFPASNMNILKLITVKLCESTLSVSSQEETVVLSSFSTWSAHIGRTQPPNEHCSGAVKWTRKEIVF